MEIINSRRAKIRAYRIKTGFSYEKKHGQNKIKEYLRLLLIDYWEYYVTRWPLVPGRRWPRGAICGPEFSEGGCRHGATPYP